MSRGPSTFQQRDLTRALKAARDAGYVDARVEIERGKIVLILGKPLDEPPQVPTITMNADEWN